MFSYLFSDSKEDNSTDSDENSENSKVEDALIQSANQSGSGSLKRKIAATDNTDEIFISKVAHLVSQKLNPTQTPRPGAILYQYKL